VLPCSYFLFLIIFVLILREVSETTERERERKREKGDESKEVKRKVERDGERMKEFFFVLVVLFHDWFARFFSEVAQETNSKIEPKNKSCSSDRFSFVCF